mmetsp:Transcript_3099/g.5688  ORF Transcript_3099/g.5688 Transcript_3099/m.5688 type:complete len:2005 (+) Transcript_3099:213-6227(+)
MGDNSTITEEGGGVVAAIVAKNDTRGRKKRGKKKKKKGRDVVFPVMDDRWVVTVLFFSLTLLLSTALALRGSSSSGSSSSSSISASVSGERKTTGSSSSSFFRSLPVDDDDHVARMGLGNKESTRPENTPLVDVEVGNDYDYDVLPNGKTDERDHHHHVESITTDDDALLRPVMMMMTLEDGEDIAVMAKRDERELRKGDSALPASLRGGDDDTEGGEHHRRHHRRDSDGKITGEQPDGRGERIDDVYEKTTDDDHRHPPPFGEGEFDPTVAEGGDDLERGRNLEGDEGEQQHASSPYAGATASRGGTLDDDAATLYYVDWSNLVCTNDPERRPPYATEVGTSLFETAGECCEMWLSHQPDIDCSELLAASPSLSSQSKRTDNTTETTTTTSVTNRPTDGSTDASPPPTPAAWADAAATYWPTYSPFSFCEFHNPEICGCEDVKQSDYRGTISTTKSGVTCDQWSNSLLTPESYPDSGLENNYCRNPVGFGEVAFCYSMDSKFEDCDVPYCKDVPPECEYPNPESCGCDNVRQADYRGTTNVTASGRECRRWSSPEVLGRGYTAENYPYGGLDENYCRNPTPDEDHQDAWCFTTDPSVEWEHCDVPLCAAPTISPQPTLSSPPTPNPTSSSDPTLALISPSETPSASSSPTHPASCMDLTIALLMPPRTNDWNDDKSAFWWRLRDGTDIKTVDWIIEYDVNSLIEGDFRYGEYNSIVIEHARSTNSRNEKICLPEGNYSFIGQMKSLSENDDAGKSVWYVLYFNGRKIGRGDLIREKFDFQLPFELIGGDKEGPGSTTNEESLGGELEPLQCYFDAFNYENVDRREVWFSEKCGPMLEDACQNDHALGFTNDVDFPEIDDFCAYHRCAYDAIGTDSTFQEWASSGEFLNCECLYHSWDCEHGSGGCESDLRKNALECFEVCPEINRRCGRGDGQSCLGFANNCCSDVDGDCKCEYMKKSCTASLKGLSINEKYLSQECLEAEEICCEDCKPVWQFDDVRIETCRCGCDVWEPICATHRGQACEFFAGRCCGSPTVDIHNPQCYCEAYTELEQHMNYELSHKESCSNADEAVFKSDYVDERESLSNIYSELGGKYWNDRSMWLEGDTETAHCMWHGVKCDATGFISEIDLTGNNLVGNMQPSRFFSSMHALKSLRLASNKLEGTIGPNSFYGLRALEHVDFSQNNLSGEVDVLLSPSIKEVNMSHNSFTYMAPFKKFRGAQQALRHLDLSYNSIHEDISDILKDIPSNLKELVLTMNHIFGSLPDALPALDDMNRFVLNNNRMTGPIPDISRSFPRLKELDLSSQKQANNNYTGLSGLIPAGWTLSPELAVLDLSNNRLTGDIPPGIGNLLHLKKLNVSNNVLSRNSELDGISADLGNLAGICEVMDLSNNKLLGQIPSTFKRFKSSPKPTLIHLNGNEDLFAPAPLDLCNVTKFDLLNHTKWCPTERNILNEFYDFTKGGEWTESTYWNTPYTPHCQWLGVTCNDDGAVIGINLTSNGLSGKLTPRISEFHSLRVLELGDNDIKDKIPSTIGDIEYLTHLRLSFNSFGGTVPTELEKLQHLEMVHLHGNRLQGIMPLLNTQHLGNESSFISDCGYPTNFGQPISCKECTICCNSDGICESTVENALQQQGFASYLFFVPVFALIVLGFTLTVAILSSYYERWYNRKYPNESDGQDGRLEANGAADTLSIIEMCPIKEYEEYALESIGEDSVYSYIFSKNKFSWLITLFVVVLQTVSLLYFIDAAMRDTENEASDWIYSFKCPRDNLECLNENDVSPLGWVIFTFLMLAHLSRDLINGLKLTVLCGKLRHERSAMIKYFSGGLILLWISSLAILSSFLYNLAIGRSETQLIENAVIVLFVCDVDEFSHMAVRAAQSLRTGTREFVDEIATLSCAVEKMSADFTKLQKKLKNQEEEIECFSEERDEKLKLLQKQYEEMEMCLQKKDEELKKVLQSNVQLELRMKALEGRVMLWIQSHPTERPIDSPDIGDYETPSARGVDLEPMNL